MMKLPLILAAVAATSFVVAQQPKQWAGKAFPDFKMTTTDGKKLSKTSLKGKVVLVDFWATWCPPCRAASPEMNKLHQSFAKNGLVVIGANLGEEKADRLTAAGKYKKEHKFGYTFTTANEDLANKLGVQGIPAFFLIDKKGVVQKQWTGFSPGVEKEMAAAIKKLTG